jgi:signal transduction histidine kinase
MLTLASGVAHELSTPLGVIAGRAEQIQARATLDERITRSAQVILEQVEHVSRVIRGLLGLARGGAPALEEVEPSAVVRGALALVEHRFTQAEVALAPKLPPALPGLRCDRKLLEHALVNLLLNACDASPRGGNVQVEARREGEEVVFCVVDDGAGILPADAARAAEPFFTTKPNGKGTGLGLAIATEIAKSHRGSLSIGPAEPHGTRACIRIPLEQGGHDARA